MLYFSKVHRGPARLDHRVVRRGRVQARPHRRDPLDHHHRRPHRGLDRAADERTELDGEDHRLAPRLRAPPRGLDPLRPHRPNRGHDQDQLVAVDIVSMAARGRRLLYLARTSQLNTKRSLALIRRLPPLLLGPPGRGLGQDLGPGQDLDLHFRADRLSQGLVLGRHIQTDEINKFNMKTLKP